MFQAPNLISRIFQKPTRVQKRLRMASRSQHRPSVRSCCFAAINACDANIFLFCFGHTFATLNVEFASGFVGLSVVIRDSMLHPFLRCLAVDFSRISNNNSCPLPALFCLFRHIKVPVRCIKSNIDFFFVPVFAFVR